jgi:DNA-directed RNA polymerase specialized sigma subunit
MAGHEELDNLYAAYKQDSSPETLTAVVRQLKPTIDYALSSSGAGHDDPVLRSRAHVLAANAITRFDPNSGAALPTWVSSQLLPLRRMRRQSQSVVKVPERIQLDAYTLSRAEREFIDQHDREPDVQELADASKLSTRRIATVRQTLKRTPSESAIGDAAPPNVSDFTSEAVDYVYQDADHVDRKILEHKTGYGGGDILPANVVSTKLGLTPTQLSRRAARLSFQIQKTTRMLQNLQ